MTGVQTCALPIYLGNETDTKWLNRVSRLSEKGWKDFVSKHKDEIRAIRKEISQLSQELEMPIAEMVQDVLDGELEDPIEAVERLMTRQLRAPTSDARSHRRRDGLGPARRVYAPGHPPARPGLLPWPLRRSVAPASRHPRRVAGSGPTVMLAHGFGITMGEWNVITDKLVAAGFRVITFDQRGHGQSDRATDRDYTRASQMEDLEAIIESLGLRSVTLIGHSMGGANAICYAAEHPEMVSALVVIEFALLILGTILFDVPLLTVEVVLIVLLGTAGYVSLTTLLGTMGSAMRSRAVLLPVLALPLLVPAVLLLLLLV